MNAGRILVGTLLATLGVVFLFDAAESADAGAVVAGWWPVALIGLGAFQYAAGPGSRRSALVLIVAGSGLLAVSSGLLGDDAWRYVWPVALVAVGVWIVTGFGRRYGSHPSEDEEVDGIAVLGSARLATRSASFRRASLTSILGGVTLDLTEAVPVAGGAAVSVTAILGGVSILVPHGWAVEIRGLPLLGGWDDTTDRAAVRPGCPRLEVQVLVALGGVEVKHPRRWR